MTARVKKNSPHPDPHFESLEVGERRFLKIWTQRQMHHAIEKHNQNKRIKIKIRCETIEGCQESGVDPGVVIRRVK
jgi:hypothetical protein